MGKPLSARCGAGGLRRAFACVRARPPRDTIASGGCCRDLWGMALFCSLRSAWWGRHCAQCRIGSQRTRHGRAVAPRFRQATGRCYAGQPGHHACWGCCCIRHCTRWRGQRGRDGQTHRSTQREGHTSFSPGPRKTFRGGAQHSKSEAAAARRLLWRSATTSWRRKQYQFGTTAEHWHLHTDCGRRQHAGQCWERQCWRSMQRRTHQWQFALRPCASHSHHKEGSVWSQPAAIFYA
mmetsp:Transcript_62551/g.114932  ORF Transcript_62551/g.114932 Transcript_62551/m.114932 type:complete len:236 (+) Transcript_62551:874-1581(+)